MLLSPAGLAPIARAGGGPENVLLVVNSSSVDSMTVANHWVWLRHIPASNVVYIDWRGPTGQGDPNTPRTTIDKFREQILSPIIAAIDSRKLAQQIDYIIYSTSFPFAIDFIKDVPQNQQGDIQLVDKHEASLSGLTYALSSVITKDFSRYTGVTFPEKSPRFMTNRYMRLRENRDGQTWEFVLQANGTIQPDPGTSEAYQRVNGEVEATTVGSHGFRSWYGWGPKGELMEAGGSRYMLSMMLGVTYGKGNTVSEILDYLQRSPAADGTAPTGTIYFTDNNDIRSTTRLSGFPMAVEQLKRLGVKAEILKGTLPDRRRDVQGLLCGAADFDWPAAHSTIRPGAICENLTSYSAVLDPMSTQSKFSEFLRHGAAGSSGTVTEPFANPNKFPHAMIQVHYARGCSLAEAFYQAVYAPYQLLIVGDPLCRPWANIPQLKIQGVATGDTLKGKVTITPSATLPRGGTVDRFRLFVDGHCVDEAGAGETLELDTTLDPDGAHELRIVGIENSPIESQGRLILPVRFDNYGKSIQFSVLPDAPERNAPRIVKFGQPIRLLAVAPGTRGVAFYVNKRVVAKFEGEKGEASVDTRLLGEGPVEVQAIGWGSGGVNTLVVSNPLLVTIEPAAPAR